MTLSCNFEQTTIAFCKDDMASALTGNLYDIATAIGADFPAKGGPGSWTVTDNLSGTLAVVEATSPLANHGNYVYTPTAAEQEAANTAGIPVNVNGTLTFDITRADGCRCIINADICFAVPPSVDPCTERYHPDQSFEQTCELDAVIDDSLATGFNTPITYALCPGQNFAAYGATPQVQPTGEISWSPTVNPSNTPLQAEILVCANSADPVGCADYIFTVNVTLLQPAIPNNALTTSAVGCELSYQIPNQSAVGMTNPVYTLKPAADITLPAVFPTPVANPAGTALTPGGLLTYTFPPSRSGTTAFQNQFHILVTGDEGCQAELIVSVTVPNFCANSTISFP